jgi:hypothetical protein
VHQLLDEGSVVLPQRLIPIRDDRQLERFERIQLPDIVVRKSSPETTYEADFPINAEKCWNKRFLQLLKHSNSGKTN